MWNLPLFSFIDEVQNSVNIFINQDQETTTLTINGHKFNNVIKLISNSTNSNNDSRFGSLSQNVNELWYDYDFGIIQFKDINDTLWSIEYPK